jgi:hypothetical protein
MSGRPEPSFARAKQRQRVEAKLGKGGAKMLRRARRKLTELETETEEFARKAAQALKRGQKLNPW